MISFVKGALLGQVLEEMIENADKFLWLISPYIKLSGRIRDDLKRIKKKDNLQITIVYGKNELDKRKSLSSDDFDFLKDFPNIKICYEKNLHAKYYASEDFSLLCSMNLHEFSQNTNIEAGVKMAPKDLISGVISAAASSSDPETAAHEYFQGIIESSDIEYYKKPVYKKGFIGLTSSYSHSEVILNKLSASRNNQVEEKTANNPVVSSMTSFDTTVDYLPTARSGYCIRTGVKIPYDVNKPLCYEAYKSWANFNNKDFPEKYCHLTGKLSHGKTSMRNPILNE